MSQQNGKTKVSFDLSPEIQRSVQGEKANPEAVFTTAKKLWQKEVWWKAYEEANPQHDVNKKKGHDAQLDK